jgi:hypothetical protein
MLMDIRRNPMKFMRKLDTAAATILLAGVAYTVVSGLLESDDDTASRRRLPTAGYALLGAATAYSAVRMVAPKTKRDQRLDQVGSWYDQADNYYRRAKLYRKAAEKIIQRLNDRRNSGK